jgi:hypothetical protein
VRSGKASRKLAEGRSISRDIDTVNIYGRVMLTMFR